MENIIKNNTKKDLKIITTIINYINNNENLKYKIDDLF